MILFANLLSAVGAVLGGALSFYTFVIFFSVIISWVNADPYSPLVRFVGSLTDPVYVRVRRVIPTRVGMVDLTPLVVLLMVQFLQAFLVQSLLQYSQVMRAQVVVTQGISL